MTSLGTPAAPVAAARVAGWVGALLAGLGWGAWFVGGHVAALVAAAIGSALLAVGFVARSRAEEGDAPATPASPDPADSPPREGEPGYESILYSISHDLRSPIGAVLNYAAILEEDYGEVLDADGVHMLSRIRSSAGNAMDRVDAVLALSRIASRELEPELLDMAALAAQAAAKCVDESVALDIGALPDIRADRELMLQVWTELLGNASRHCARCEEPSVKVSGSASDEGVLFEVSDNGDGFDMRFVSKLFRPFERLHAATEASGPGMGLAMVATIVHRHGGQVSAKGEPGRGATFRFRMPVASKGAP